MSQDAVHQRDESGRKLWWVLAGYCVVLVLGGVWAVRRLGQDRTHRDQFDRVVLGMTGAEVDAVFARPAECTIEVEGHEARYYVSPVFPGKNLCKAARLAVATWTDVPRGPYCAALVVVEPVQGVAAMELCGESVLVRSKNSKIPDRVGSICYQKSTGQQRDAADRR